MNVKSKWMMALLISSVTSFYLGAYLSKRLVIGAVAREFRDESASIDLGQYLEFRGIALSIQKADYNGALCAAELGASSKLDNLRECAAKSDCRNIIEFDLKKYAPEALGVEPLKFSYREIKNGVRKCR